MSQRVTPAMRQALREGRYVSAQDVAGLTEDEAIQIVLKTGDFFCATHKGVLPCTYWPCDRDSMAGPIPEVPKFDP